MNDKWMEAGFMLIQQVAHLAKYQTLKEMESCGLKPNQAGILVVLRSEGGLSQKELAKRMGVTPPSMTAALKKMEKQEYIGKLGKKLFLLFCWLFCILVVAAFADVVAGL